MRVCLVLLLLGCSGETTARLTIKPGAAQPRSLRLTLWGDGLLRAPIDLALGTHNLPGTLILRKLDARTPDFRILIEGLDNQGAVASEAGAHVPLADGQEVGATVQLLDAQLADSDGDGVPDIVDDCPQVADTDQRCTAPKPDLAGNPDLASADLRAPDDLAAPKDLASSDLARSASCPSFALFCDDFESGNLSKWGTLYTEGGSSTLAVDGTQKWAGNFAAHAVGSGGLTWAPKILTPAISSGMIAFRSYFYSPTTLVPHIYFFYLHRMGADSDYNLGWDNFGGPAQWTMFNKNPGNADGYSGSAAPGVWHCVELDVTFNAGANLLEFYLDGAAAQTLNVPAAQAAPSLDEFDIGVTYQNVSSGNQWYFDDVVLATQHIGCE